MINWIVNILDGRPMRPLGYAFSDDEGEVYVWLDCYERVWLARDRWGWFRVLSEEPDRWLDLYRRIPRHVVSALIEQYKESRFGEMYDPS